MKKFLSRCVVWVAMSLFATTTIAQFATSQDAVAQLLKSDDPFVISRALASVENIRGDEFSSELRASLLAALERENDRVASRWEASQHGGQVEALEEGGTYGTLIEVVVRLKDVNSIPALAGSLGTGTMTINALADFGDPAADPVLKIAESPNSPTHKVDDSLRTLRLLVEMQARRPLRAGTLQRIQRVTAQRLTGSQFPTTLWNASDLAASLGDTESLRLVKALADDSREVAARGVSDPGLVEQVRSRAAAALARSKKAAK